MTSGGPAPSGGDPEWHWFVVAAPGLEALVASEARAIAPEAPVREVPGGVEVDGPLELGARLNLHLRSASRVLLRIGSVDAKDFRKLRSGAAALPWERFVAPGRALDLKVTARKCRLYHTTAIGERVEAAIRERVVGGEGGSGGDDPPQAVHLRGFRDHFEFSVDASGALLHRRGWRLETASAPLRETLAAGILGLCGWAGNTPLVDPMCGSGTIPIEALSSAMGTAPGLDRDFSFLHWPACDRESWESLRESARASAGSGPAGPSGVILAADRDPGAVGVARRNAERAGVADRIAFHVTPFEELVVPSTPGLVVINPPYGKRASAGDDLRALFGSIGRVLAERYRGWRAGVVVPDRSLVDRLGLREARVHSLDNGGLRIWLVHGRIAESNPGPS